MNSITGSKSAAAADGISKYTASFALSLGITSVLSALLVILKETNEATVLQWMKTATPHHWITHGAIDLLLFFILGFALLGAGEKIRTKPGNVTAIALGGVVTGALIIAGFFV